MIKKLENKSLILYNQTFIYIMTSHDKIELNIYDEKMLKFQYSTHDKFNNGSFNELIFEVTRDLADPTLDFFPFLFYERIDKAKFDVYFCLMNVERAGEYIKEKCIENLNIETKNFDFWNLNKLIEFKKLDFY